ncbi:rRNA 2'-O-methyltransferase fibrillarin [Trifolium repens]|nr:rRNA 2'-O-methyltransferase fibrillarin [Trifolium repens]
MPSSKHASFFQRKQSEKKKPYPKRRSLGGRMMEAQPIAPSKNGELTIGDLCRARGREVLPLHFLVECATGYALFLAHGINDIDMKKYQPAEEYINQSDTPFELKAYLPFSSFDNALLQMNAISNSSVTDKLIKFIQKNFEPPFHRHMLATADPLLGHKIVNNARLSHQCSFLTTSVMRGLREKIDKLIGLQPGELDNAQRQLWRLYNDQMLPGEALYGEKLIRVQNEDETEVEYRVCDPSRSKLGAAIMGGVTNIWIKPGSRVMYVGNVCGLTVSDLSDLVGLDGLVYVVSSDYVAHMAGKRPNVVTITENDRYYSHDRMLLGMVDAVFGEIDHPLGPLGQIDYHLPQKAYMDGLFIVNNVRFHLKAGGFYMISTKANDMNSTGHLIFSYGDLNKEFKLIQTVPLDLVEGAYALNIGGYRIPDE